MNVVQLLIEVQGTLGRVLILLCVGVPCWGKATSLTRSLTTFAVLCRVFGLSDFLLKFARLSADVGLL